MFLGKRVDREKLEEKREEKGYDKESIQHCAIFAFTFQTTSGKS